MTKASTKKGMAGKIIAGACSLALAASLTPAAALTAFAATAPTAANGKVAILVKEEGATSYVNGFANVADDTLNNVVDLRSADVKKVKGNQSTLYFTAENSNTKEGKWGVVTSSNLGVASFDEILGNAKSTAGSATATSYWKPGAKMTLSATSTPAATDPTFTYEELQAAKNYYPYTTQSDINASGSTAVTPGIALYTGNSTIGVDSNAQATADTIIKGNAWTNSNTVSVGLSSANYDVANLAKLMPGVAFLTITIPAQEYPKVPRIYGEDWNDTMNAVVNATAGFANETSFVVASSNNYQDALTASGLAGALQCPLLLTDKDELTKQAADQITALADPTNGAKVYVIGGPLAVSDSVATAINNLDAIRGKVTNPIVRLAGETASETSLAVYNEMAKLSQGGTPINMNKVVVTTSIAFQDAMSISPYTYSQKIPVVLTGEGNVLESDTLIALGKQTKTGLANALVLGGNLAVSDSVERQLFDNGLTTVKRIGEETCWETSNAIAEYLFNTTNGVWSTTIPTAATVATGDNYLDALVASQYCGVNTRPLLLVGNGQGGDCCVTNYIYDNGTTLKTTGVTIIGGPQAVSPSIAAQINKIVG